MDIRTQDGYGTKKPRGQATTLLDLVSRDQQDNTFFPLNTDLSWFVRNEQARTIPVSGVFREFTFKGPAEFGQRFTFEIGDYQAGDMIQGLFIQVQLSHWLTGRFRDLIRQGKFVYKNQSDIWTYINGLGTALLEEATLEMDDQVLERITGDSANVISALFPDLNTQIGIAGVEGRYTLADVKAWGQKNFFPSEDGWITVPLPFSMLRERVRGTFPLISCREGTVRINVTLKRFDQLVRNITGKRLSCEDTPLGKTIPFLDVGYLLPQTFNQTTPANPPDMRNIQLLVYGYFVDGPYREKLMRSPYQKAFREIQQFDFTEPLKYVINKKGNDTITIQLPLEANQPVEEIVWFLRRKASIIQNNNWTNYSATLEKDYNPTFAPLVPLLRRARIQANSIDVIDKDEAWFRSHIARAHKGGSVAYDSFVYGYSFARHPGEHDPTGSINASRLSNLRLTLDVAPPIATTPGEDTEWEVRVFVFAWQWLRFENGICNKIFID